MRRGICAQYPLCCRDDQHERSVIDALSWVLTTASAWKYHTGSVKLAMASIVALLPAHQDMDFPFNEFRRFGSMDRCDAGRAIGPCRAGTPCGRLFARAPHIGGPGRVVRSPTVCCQGWRTHACHV